MWKPCSTLLFALLPLVALSARVNIAGTSTVTTSTTIDDYTSLSGSEKLKQVVASRQYKYSASSKRKRLSALWSRDDTCPPMPLPTIGCKSCTLCTGTSSSYCASASTSNDPNSCGICQEERQPCLPPPAASPRLASTCTAGQCGYQCDTSRGYTGPATDCQNSPSAMFLTAPAVPPNAPQYKLSRQSIFTRAGGAVAPGSWGVVYETINPSTGSLEQLQCLYLPDSGILYFERYPGYQSSISSTTDQRPIARLCPAMLEASTTGRGCYQVGACAPVLPSNADLQIYSAQSYVLSSSTAPVQYLLRCNYQSSIATLGCTYDQDTLAATMVGSLNGVPQSLDLCPPLRTEYKGFCFTP